MLGWNSFRGRYLILAGSMAALLFAAALIGWRHVQKIATEQIANVEERARAASVVADMIDQLRTLDARAHGFLIVPSAEMAQAIRSALNLNEAAVVGLGQTSWVQRDSEISAMVAGLQRDSVALKTLGAELIRMRQDARQWLPAVRIMEQRMQPAAQRFYSAVDLAIQDSLPLASDPTQLENYGLFIEARRAASRMISEFRLFLANRFGVFDDRPERGLRIRSQHIDDHWVSLRTNLETLSAYDQEKRLGLVQATALNEMRESILDWRIGYTEVRDALQSRGWRSDVELLHDRMEPLMDRMRQRLSSLELELGVGSARDITQLTTVSRQLSNTILILAFGALVSIAIAYAVLNRLLLRPISRIAEALRAEANGAPGVVIPNATAQETANLTEAFSEMRRQVRQREARLDHLAHHDPLTALPNRTLFRDRLSHALDIAERNGTLVGLLFLDLDRFKQINDSLGHVYGDQLLTTVARRLQDCIRSGDTIARLGGDEFAVIVEGGRQVQDVKTVAEKLLSAFRSPFVLDEREVHVSASIGMSLYPADDRDPDALIRDADLAMYGAKDMGRNTYRFFSSEMTSRVQRVLELETHLRAAVDNGDLGLHFQPIVDAPLGTLCGCEALLRWTHPTRGPVSPAEFVPILEETGLIVPASEWVVHQVCAERRRILELGLECPPISINLSGRLLHGNAFVNFLVRVLEEGGTDPRELVLEITEDTLAQQLRAAQFGIRRLRDMGVRVALDDFGTGQSSLNHLRSSPIDVVKIDRDFIRRIATDPYDAALVKAIIAMTQGLKLSVVAEGVETVEQLEFMRANGCDRIQGFLFSRPLPADELIQLIGSRHQWGAEYALAHH